jgi:hypothetical protein
MTKREATTRRNRGRAPSYDKQSMVTMPGGRVQMLGPVAIGAPSSPKYLGPRSESSNTMTLSHTPVKK